jgi:ketosteroid isomerase-like protein
MDSINREVIEKAQIRELLARLARAVDRVDEEGIRACYTEDGQENHGPFAGSAAEFARNDFRSSDANRGASHQLAQSLIEIDGDRATSETYFQCVQLVGSRNGLTELVTWGRFLDHLRRDADGWRITRRRVVLDWAAERKATAWKRLDAFPRGERAPADLVYRPKDW